MCVEVTVITPSPDTSETPIEMEDWRVFHNQLYRRFTRSSQEILNEIGSDSITLDILKELKLGSRMCLRDDVMNFFFALLGERERHRNIHTFIQEIFS